MQQQVGWKLTDAEGNVVNQWGGIWGVIPDTPNPLVLPNGDQVCAPAVGVDYDGYTLVAWMMDEPPPVVPSGAPMGAVRTVLQDDGLFDQAQALISASTDNALKNVWEYGNVAQRNSPAINSLGEALGLTQAEIDQMFFDAAALIV